MGALFGYYAAADDAHAAGAVVREDGQAPGAGYDELVVKGIDPAVGLLPAEALVTGRTADDIAADPRYGHLVAQADGGGVVAVSLTDALRDALVGLDGERAAEVARGWAESEELGGQADPGGLTDFLTGLAALAERASAKGHRLYCWISL